MKINKYIISCGGTGGHIFPAISIANKIKEKDPKSSILFVGSSSKMEMSKVPESGYKIIGLPIKGFNRSFPLKNIFLPFRIFYSLLKSLTVIFNFKPDVVIGTGGYASGPIVFISQILGYPTLIQEQNSYPGITNKILGKRAKTIAVAYPDMEKYFIKEKIVLTGNPVRKDIINSKITKLESKLFFNLDSKKPTIGIIGGSLGALKINQIICNNISFLKKNGFQVIWQCGKLYYESYKVYDCNNIKVVPFISKMNCFYKAIDILISRSGASTISEICLTGTPSILIPSPNVAANHQYFNAMELYKKQLSEIIQEKDLERDFRKILKSFWLNNSLRNKIKIDLKKLSKPNATDKIVEHIKTYTIEK